VIDPVSACHRRQRRPRLRRRQKPVEHAHGWTRAGDPTPVASTSTAPTDRRRRAPTGTSFLLTIAVTVLTAIGIVRVHASIEVLELGGEITELTEEQAHLLEERRRLTAERAYLRHPDQIDVAARRRLGLVPVSPQHVQQIRVVQEAPAP
jgi:hypothetical protein